MTKHQKIEQALRQLYAANLIDDFFSKVASMIVQRDRDAKVAGVKSLQDPSTGYVHELDDEAVTEHVRYLLEN